VIHAGTFVGSSREASVRWVDLVVVGMGCHLVSWESVISVRRTVIPVWGTVISS
jgi:hypothetical protein